MDTWNDDLLKCGDEVDIYITSHALTQGIKKDKMSWMLINYEPCGKGASRYSIFYPVEELGKTWHLTWESAVEAAEIMRAKKLKSLKRQIQRVSGIEFKKPEGIN